MGYMLDFVVDLVEELVELDGSQFSESIVERCAWITLVSLTGFSLTGLSVRSEEPDSSRKELTSIC